ncbi:hypothetical protein CP97_06610 [Aurantiacibacter atlanticus]|uniref:SURF1-like protein n=1 Tax=Aurantiacibacter atlanticus TaxID=1648404 RepID=A0A0H4VFB3_9SPHN|nr:SURF1 family protein [Aurantiacibacter atlanticus]AKQ41764.1 hypothetical protein CP97_06610 [Aurantiacibacter atlanticus]
MTGRKIPIIPTVFVVAAAATMVVLGFWQLGRKDEKEALIARYQGAADLPLLDPIPIASEPDAFLYRRAALDCREVTGWNAIAGRNANGASGYVQIASCQIGESQRAQSDQPMAEVVAGWSRDLQLPDWDGGPVTGIIARGGENGWRLVADSPLADELQANATPDPRELPNNHLAYAGQWFFFALTALGIYWLALRRRWRNRG